MENSEFVSDLEWNSYINYSISELRDILISKVGNDYFASSASISLLPNQDTYFLPLDFYKLLWAEVLGNDGYYYKIKRFEVTEKNHGRSPLNYFITDLKYRLRNGSIVFNTQKQTTASSVRVWYTPVLQELVSDGDTLDGFNGWDEFVVLKAARKALVKEETSTNELDQELAVMYARLESMGDNRDQGEPMRIYNNELRQYGGSYYEP
jgi:hypothetical protein